MEFTEIPYKGAAPILEDIAAGCVHLYADGVPSSLALHKAGRARVLAISSEERLAEANDIPTFKELGYPGMSSSTYMAFFARAETPENLLRVIGNETMKTMHEPAIRERMVTLGAIPWLGTPAEFAAYAKKDFQAWQDDIKRRGNKP